MEEAETESLVAYLQDWPGQASSALARTEVMRAARARGPEVVAKARRLLASLYLIPIDNAQLDDAAFLEPLTLRSLDAIHLAAARTLDSDLARLITYDARMAAAARALGITVDAPGT